MNEFVNPKSMLTPGMAGALVMFLSNAICFQFPEVQPRWTALALSFTVGFLVMAAAKLKLAPMTGYWLVNSLIIFSVAAGSAGVAARATRAPMAALIVEKLIPSAHAQEATKAASPAVRRVELEKQLAQLTTQLAAQQKELEQTQVAANNAMKVATKERAQRELLEARSQQASKATAESTKLQANRFFKSW